MSNATLNNRTRDALMQIFQTQGLVAADEKVRELLKQCESWKDRQHERGIIKGELSEIALEYHLLWWMQHVPNLTCVKSLCIKSANSKATAEIDILLASPYKIYLFECKSFKGDKVLTKECFLKGASSSKDVYEQSRYHLRLLDENIGYCRPPLPTHVKTAPYQLVLFELSSNSLEDRRETKWQKAIPALSLSTLDAWLLNEFSRTTISQWDYPKLVAALKKLNSTSEKMFDFHMKKIYKRGKQ